MLRRESQVKLALDAQVAALAPFLAELTLAWFHLGGQQVGLGLETLGLADVVLPLGPEEGLLVEQELVERAPANGPD